MQNLGNSPNPGRMFNISACLVTQSYPTQRPHGLQPASLPCPWNSPGKHTGVGCHALLQGIFTIQGSNPGLLHCWQILYCLCHQGSPLHGPETYLTFTSLRDIGEGNGTESDMTEATSQQQPQGQLSVCFPKQFIFVYLCNYII